ncbi:hypothetical protein RS9917_00065 [Synechococcus sp. RS9917]|nr:hypothetical protein RS9917_00065 [Synechococcus sp. RS9917]
MSASPHLEEALIATSLRTFSAARSAAALSTMPYSSMESD